jgi:hypothetical protein
MEKKNGRIAAPTGVSSGALVEKAALWKEKFFDQ